MQEQSIKLHQAVVIILVQLKGHKIVVFRDCTTGLHTAETLDGLWANKL